MQIEKTGAIVLQARFFSEIVRRLPESTLTLEVLDNNQVAITSEKPTLPSTADADSYPHLPVVESQDSIEIPAHVLNKVVSETVFAVSQHESRPILTGVHFVLENQNY